MQSGIFDLNVVDGKLVISVPTKDLISVIKLGPYFADQEDFQIVDEAAFINDLLGFITAEQDDGTTPLFDIFDQAAIDVVEWGCDSIVYSDDNS